MKKIKMLVPLTTSLVLAGTVIPMVSCAKSEPKDFATDDWSTVISVCNKGFKEFAKVYCNSNPSTEDEAKEIINNWILQEPNGEDDARLRTITITHGSYLAEAKVRLIGIDYDELYESKKGEKAKFTFEFEDIIDVCAYDANKDNTWYQDPKEGKPLKSCFLRNYLNDYVFYMLPKEVRKAIKKVNKLTYGFVYDESAQEPVSTYEIHSPEYLFPLSATEVAQMPEEIQAFGFESNPYTYYSDVVYTQGEGDYYYTKSWKHIKYYYGTDYEYGYWVRTPGWASNAYGSTLCSDHFGEWEGKFYTDMPVDAGYGLAPCFCI